MPVKMTADDAMRQACNTSDFYADRALAQLVKLLKIDTKKRAWRKDVEPFAPVWAAMISAAAQDYSTSVQGGYVEGGPK